RQKLPHGTRWPPERLRTGDLRRSGPSGTRSAAACCILLRKSSSTSAMANMFPQYALLSWRTDMPVRKRGRFYHYHFWESGREYRGTTKQLTKTAAERYESELRTRIRQRGGYVTRRAPILSNLAAEFLLSVRDNSNLDRKTKLYY